MTAIQEVPGRPLKKPSMPISRVIEAIQPIAFVVAVWLIRCGAAAAGEELQLLPSPAAGGPQRAFAAKGTDLCVRCHRSEQSAWVDASTTAVWRHDAHSRAHLALSPDNARTRGMEAVLGIKAATTAACVACHTHPAGEPAVEEETAMVHGGISCERIRLLHTHTHTHTHLHTHTP